MEQQEGNGTTTKSARLRKIEIGDVISEDLATRFKDVPGVLRRETDTTTSNLNVMQEEWDKMKCELHGDLANSSLIGEKEVIRKQLEAALPDQELAPKHTTASSWSPFSVLYAGGKGSEAGDGVSAVLNNVSALERTEIVILGKIVAIATSKIVEISYLTEQIVFTCVVVLLLYSRMHFGGKAGGTTTSSKRRSRRTEYQHNLMVFLWSVCVLIAVQNPIKGVGDGAVVDPAPAPAPGVASIRPSNDLSTVVQGEYDCTQPEQQGLFGSGVGGGVDNPPSPSRLGGEEVEEREEKWKACLPDLASDQQKGGGEGVSEMARASLTKGLHWASPSGGRETKISVIVTTAVVFGVHSLRSLFVRRFVVATRK